MAQVDKSFRPLAGIKVSEPWETLSTYKEVLFPSPRGE